MPLPAIAAVASAGVGIAGAAGAFRPDDPASPDYGRITRDAQQASIDLIPDKYRAQREYNPKFAALQRQVQYENLFGTTAGERTEDYIAQERRTRQVRNPNAQYFNGRLIGGGPEFVEEVYYEPVTRQRTVATEGSPGMIALAQQAAPALDQLAIDSRTRGRRADVADVAALGPDAFRAIQAYDPAMAGVSDELIRQAQEELAAGRSLTAAEQREAQQAIRGAQAARGMGYGNSDVFTEAMTLGQAGTARQAQRRGFASAALGQRAALYGDPFQQIIGRSSGRVSDPSGYLGAAGGAVPDYTGINPAAYGLAGQGYAAQNAAQAAGYNQRMSSLGALTGNAGALGSAVGDLGTALGNYYNTGVFSAADRGSLGGW